MKQKIIEHIKSLMKEHEEAGYCTDWEEVENECDVERSGFIGYDCGKYETLIHILNAIKNMED